MILLFDFYKFHLKIKYNLTYRYNQKNWEPTFVTFYNARKRIETVFSQLCDQFMMTRNYAKQTKGLFTRIIGKISALTVLQYINKISIDQLDKLNTHYFNSANGFDN